MSPRKYTLLIIPEGSHRVRRFSIKRGIIQSALGGVVICVLALSLLIFDYSRIHFDRSELRRLQAENLRQRNEIQTLAADLQNLRKEMVILTQNDAKVRVLANLAKPKSDGTAGMGGPPEEETVAEFSELQRQIDQLRRTIDLRRESQEEIRGFLNDQRSMMAAKPEGVPVKGWMTSKFGMRKSPFTGKRKMHEGVDIAARTGTPIHASADGIVSQARTAPGYGKLVVIDHGYGYKTYYAHNSKIHVKVGQRVKRGDQISAVGNTGSSTGSHLHYEVRLNGVPVNPNKYF